MKTAFLFAGQGSQFAGMGNDFLENYSKTREMFEKASEILGYDLSEILNDETKLNQTIYTQPALFTLDYAIAEIMKEKGIIPDCVAGLSLGEYNALVSAKALDFDSALNIIKQRAQIMDSALEKGSSGMAAVLKADLAKINEVLSKPELNNEIAICNENSYDQVVIGGNAEKLEIAIELLKDAGFKRVIPLSVSTVSHMYLLNDASLKLQEVLKKYEFNKPAIPFINNINAEYQSADFVTSLTKQIATSTHMAQTIELMLNSGIEMFIEIGPKKTLSGFVKSVAKTLDKEVKIYNVYDITTLNNFLLEMSEMNE